MAYTTIDDPQKYFSTKLYSGNGGTQSVTGVGFQPDLVWIKHRTAGHDHNAWDSTRGVQEMITPNENYVEAGSDSHGANGVTAFGVDGFTLGDVARSNDPEAALVSWNWKANGGTTTSVSASGSGASQVLASTHQANTTSGFSIVRFTGVEANATVTHGLGAVPEVIFLKDLPTENNWIVYHKSQGNDDGTYLNLDSAEVDNATFFNDTTPTSTVFSVGTNNKVNRSGSNSMLAYCFAPIQGFSKFGNYTGNGNADGPFVYTGFKPKWLVVKPINAQSSWFQLDSERDPVNPANQYLQLNTNAAEASSSGAKDIDFLSNGFKGRAATGWFNDSGENYLYMAFAESPFVTSNGSPANAK